MLRHCGLALRVPTDDLRAAVQQRGEAMHAQDRSGDDERHTLGDQPHVCKLIVGTECDNVIAGAPGAQK